jgi:hypothetical protein
LIEPATIIAIITAIGAILTAVASIIWAYSAYRVVSAVPPESWDMIIKGGLLVAGIGVSAYLVKAIRAK